ncbi:hypothetical protein Q3G72_020249 [Acer saccharum]|nr:hypothetical protein Q3G72_020249 [Acer saccharum]
MHAGFLDGTQSRELTENDHEEVMKPKTILLLQQQKNQKDPAEAKRLMSMKFACFTNDDCVYQCPTKCSRTYCDHKGWCQCGLSHHLLLVLPCFVHGSRSSMELVEKDDDQMKQLQQQDDLKSSSNFSTGGGESGHDHHDDPSKYSINRGYCNCHNNSDAYCVDICPDKCVRKFCYQCYCQCELPRQFSPNFVVACDVPAGLNKIKNLHV